MKQTKPTKFKKTIFRRKVIAILLAIEQDPTIGTAELVAKTGLSRRDVAKYLPILNRGLSPI